MAQSDQPSQQIGIQSNDSGNIDIGNNNTFTIAGRDIHIHNLSSRKFYIFQLALCIPSLILLLLGLKDVAKPAFPAQYLAATPVIGGLLVAGALFLLIFSLFSTQKNSRKALLNRSHQILIVTNALSIMVSLISSSLLTVVLIHPSGCPTYLCATQQIITKVSTNPDGIHDEFLEVYPITLQNTSFVIPGDPVQYAKNTLPQAIGAVRFDAQPSVSLYRVIVGVHSLQYGSYGIILKQVGLEILQKHSVPYPLNIWNTGSTAHYDTNLYGAVYGGEPPRSIIPTTYIHAPLSTVSLSPGEPDQLDIQLRSLVPADIQFRIQITYRLVNEHQSHSLTLPTPYEVMFSNVSNWNVYQFQYGHFVLST